MGYFDECCNHILTKYRRDLTHYVVSFRPVSESSGNPPSFHEPTPPPFSIPIPIQETGNTLMTLLGLRVSMGGGNHLLFVARVLVCPSICFIKKARHKRKKARNTYSNSQIILQLHFENAVP
ncbi:hypothetical protein EVAR_85456_1 [Eumeta japonica]|uniref:Uncharacterized protein n=1 Tax=Eumeta variegata TaxID=151549 RepID=A0A4C1WJP4_EUMVA|nr:hypothetical protein EVAR_85456_1 [Eumeta japonica]